MMLILLFFSYILNFVVFFSQAPINLQSLLFLHIKYGTWIWIFDFPNSAISFLTFDEKQFIDSFFFRTKLKCLHIFHKEKFFAKYFQVYEFMMGVWGIGHRAHAIHNFFCFSSLVCLPMKIVKLLIDFANLGISSGNLSFLQKKKGEKYSTGWCMTEHRMIELFGHFYDKRLFSFLFDCTQKPKSYFTCVLFWLRCNRGPWSLWERD